MVIVVASSFLLCWSPFYLVTLISQLQEKSFLKKANFISIMLTIHLAGFLNSCLNPFIYNCMSHQFRASFRTILRHLCFPFRPESFELNKNSMRSDFTNTTVVKGMTTRSRTNEYILTDDKLAGSHRFYMKRRQKNDITEL